MLQLVSRVISDGLHVARIEALLLRMEELSLRPLPRTQVRAASAVQHEWVLYATRSVHGWMRLLLRAHFMVATWPSHHLYMALHRWRRRTARHVLRRHRPVHQVLLEHRDVLLLLLDLLQQVALVLELLFEQLQVWVFLHLF